jgi:trehalose/maltose hydrolase-like predicted phosphorylase
MDKNWIVYYQGWNEDEHPLQEALCTLGNGYIATRAALETEGDEGFNYPGTYLAGGYNRMKSEIQNREVENEDLVNWPNWLFLTFRVGDGEWFSIRDAEILEFETRLDLKAGMLERRMKFRDAEGRQTSIVSKRIVSMVQPHAAAIKWRLKPENWSGKICIRSGINGNLINNNVDRYSDLNQDHVEVLETGHTDNNLVYMLSRTKQSRILMAQALRTCIYSGEKAAKVSPRFQSGNGFASGDLTLDCSKGREVLVEKTMAVYTSRDFAISDPLTEAKSLLARLDRFDELAAQQARAWKQLWHYNDIEMDSGDDTDQLVLRLHVFHLYQTVSHNSIDLDIGVPARGWHGEGYRGHIFWDELYILPFINLHNPQLSRSLLMYRYRRLGEARHAARNAGFEGAMFPWQSGSNGREETQKIHLNPKSGRWLPDVSHLQYHINAAIPYNVWHYYQATADVDFLMSHGGEIILSCALFWSSVATYNKKRERYEINGVMGPDEYHTHYPEVKEAGLNNNAYTNIMAVWVLGRALRVMELLGEECCRDLNEKVGVTPAHVSRWKKICKKMVVPFQNDQLILQFEGYEKLKELDWDHYHNKYGKALRLDRLLESEGDSCNNYKASKQADVLMLFYLFSSEELCGMLKNLGYDFRPESIPENIDYYRRRTAHGSTLSQVIHAWVYARSHRSESWRRFREALMSDFKDVQGGTTHEGIHLGAMAGTLDLMQRCYSGLEIRDDVLWFNPQLPDDLRTMSFHIRFRGHWIKISLDQEKLHVQFDKGLAPPVHMAVSGEKLRFETGDKRTFQLK